MRAILVDDEMLALEDLERQLKLIGGLDIAGTYPNAFDALDAVATLAPQVVFLDIDMPGMSGLEAAERFQNDHPSVQVVFVTAHDDHAVRAFELQAIDYVLKPIRHERLAQTVRRLIGRLEPEKERPAAAQPVFVRCFGRMQIEYGNNEQLAWRTTKAQELFAYLLFRKDHSVRKDQLIDILWPEVDYKKAYTQLYTTIYQMRRSLEAAGLPIRIVNSGSSYSLDLGGLASDADQWERMLEAADGMAEAPLNEYQSWLNLYAGDYLEEHDYLWAERERYRLRSLWQQHALQLARSLEASDWRAAAAWYLQVQRRLPGLEETYFALMKLYDKAGERVLVKQQYDLLAAMSLEEYDTEPSEAVRTWYERWRRLD